LKEYSAWNELHDVKMVRGENCVPYFPIASPSIAEVNAWSYTSTSPYAFMAWCSVKAQG